MEAKVLTSWGDYQIAVDRLLDRAGECLRVFDSDLAQLKLESPERVESLRRLLQAGRPDCLRFAIRQADLLRDRSPRLLGLLRSHGHQFAAVETPESLSHLRDCMLIADDRHALIRFDQDHPRCRLFLDAPDDVAPYLRKFEEIWSEGGHRLSPTVVGL